MVDSNRGASVFEQIVYKIDPQAKLLRVWELKGGVSAEVTALEIERADTPKTEKMIVRRHGEIDRNENPNIAADEFKLLQHLKAAGLTVPSAYYFDLSNEILPTPYVVIEYIEGATEFAPVDVEGYVHQLATHLTQIHQVDWTPINFLPRIEQLYAKKFSQRPAKVDDSIDEGWIRDVLEKVWPLPQRNPSVLLHGDFWPGNVLWQDGQVAAVIDWEDAKIGDPLTDLGSSRLEILWAFGIEALNSFTEHYQAMNSIDFTNLPYWDLCAALRPAFKISEWAGDNIEVEKRMRDRHRIFVRQAFEKLQS